MKVWDLPALGVKAHRPEILSSTEDARAVLIELPAGESLEEHEVHERAWVVLVQGKIAVTDAAGKRVEGGPGLLLEFEPRERHQVDALAASRLLLILTPWPGQGHPGAMTIEEKSDVRSRAAERANR